MIIYYSILVYTVVVAGFGQFLRKENRRRADLYGRDYNFTKTVPWIFALATFALLVFFVGMRSDYGDTYNYMMNYKELVPNLSIENLRSIYEKEDEGIGYKVIQMLFKKYISTDYTDWFMAQAIFQAGAFVLLSYKYSVNYVMSSFLFVASTQFQWMMNGVRQYTAACLIFYFFSLVTNRKLLRFLIVVLIAYTIHSTAIFWIPVYFIVKYKPFSKQIWMFVALTLIVVFFVDTFTNLLDSSLEGTEYAGTGATIMNYGNDGGAIDDGVNPIRVLVAAVPAGIALWRKKYIDEKSNPTIDIMINLSTASVGMYLLAMVTSGILVGRVPAYFIMVNYILIPWLLENAFEGKFKWFMKAMCYILYFAYFYYVIVVQGEGYYVSDVLGITYIC